MLIKSRSVAAAELPSESRNRRQLLGCAWAAGLLAARPVWGQPSVSSKESGSRSTALVRAEERQKLCSAVNKMGVGLRGEYFSERDCLGSRIASRLDGPIEFTTATDWPARPVLSARWTGWVKPPLPGKYSFFCDHPDSIVTLAKDVVVGAGASKLASVELAAGRYYPLEVRINRAPASLNTVRLEWTAPHGIRFLVPRAALYPPTA